MLVGIASEQGKLRVATDMAQIELIVSSLCELEALSEVPMYQCLRALRPLLFGTVEDVCKQADTLPPIVVLQLLFNCSAGAIPMPYVVLGWSAAEYGIQHTWPKQESG